MPGAEAPDILLGLDALWLSTGILLATYALLISERVHRTVAAMLGAGICCMLITIGSDICRQKVCGSMASAV